MPCTKGEKLQRAYLKINKKLGLNDKIVELIKLVTPDPLTYDSDVSDVPDDTQLTQVIVYTFPPSGGCSLSNMNAAVVKESEGRYLIDDMKITIPGGLLDPLGVVIPESDIKAIRRITYGGVMYDLIEPFSPKSDAHFLGAILEWGGVMRLLHGG